ncbi:hypothetical protein [Tenacibaculum sp. 190524A02b]|uniref:hypothetical protein n=1 Tax=Tenacibaculum vairaonense TaxID=3137860 RepID=UPI0032B28108
MNQEIRISFVADFYRFIIINTILSIEEFNKELENWINYNGKEVFDFIGMLYILKPC